MADNDDDDDNIFDSRGGRGEAEAGMGPSDERFGISVSETVKKLFSAGVSAAFMTEESIRHLVSEMKLPKESLNFLLQGASKSKEELMSRVGGEVIKIIQKIDFVKEVSRFMEEHKFKVSAEIEVLKKDKPKSGDPER